MVYILTGTTNGHFTTKSAYTLQLENKENLMGSSSNQKRSHTYWKGIWGVKIPNKILVFTWRACHSTLPTRTNLFKRGVVSSCVCPVCHEEAETVSLKVLIPINWLINPRIFM